MAVEMMTDDPRIVTLMHKPQAVSWDAALAQGIITRTAASFGRLSWPPASEWIDRHRRLASPAWNTVDAADAAIQAAWTAQSVEQVVYACRRWWRAVRVLAEMLAVGGFVARTVPHLEVVAEALPPSVAGAESAWDAWVQTLADRHTAEHPAWQMTWETPTQVRRVVQMGKTLKGASS